MSSKNSRRNDVGSGLREATRTTPLPFPFDPEPGQVAVEDLSGD
jgi:hypothetical protein